MEHLALCAPFKPASRWQSQTVTININSRVLETLWCQVGLQATNTHTHPFNGPFSGTTQVSRYQKGKTNLDFTEARDSEWQRHQLYHMQVCTSLKTDNHTSTPPLKFFTGRIPSCCPANIVKALKVNRPVKTKYNFSNCKGLL